MASIWKRGGVFYVTWLNEHGRRITKSTGLSSRTDAAAVGKKWESHSILTKHGMIEPASARHKLEHEPISDLLDAWKRAKVAANVTARHAYESHFQAKRVLDKAGIRTLAQLRGSTVQEALGKIRKDEKLSLNTLHHHLRAVKSFSRWLWRDGVIRDDPLSPLRGYNWKTDRKYIRRAMTLKEVKALLTVADAGQKLWEIDGPDRAMMYRLMIGTGFRVGEVRSLMPANFLLEEDPPCVIVGAAYSKHRREDRQPIRVELAAKLKPWLVAKALHPHKPVFRIPDKPNRILQHDLAAAKIKEETDQGILDLHSLRHTFVTECVRTLPPKIAQQLARHSSIQLTMDLYTHLEPGAAGKALQQTKFFGEKGHKTKGKRGKGGKSQTGEDAKGETNTGGGGV